MLIYVKGPEEPLRKKCYLSYEGQGIIFSKSILATNWQLLERKWKGVQHNTNFDAKKLNNLIKRQSAIKWDYNTYEKRLQNIFTSWMSFQLLLQPRFYNLLLHSQNEGNLMPPTPPVTGKGQQWQIPHELGLFEKLRFLIIIDNQFKLFNNNTTGKVILYLFKNLDSVVVPITYNYPSITKICCRKWKL